MTVKAIIIFILIFGVLVLFHEFGHFVMAKRAGIFVREFSIGMGPLLFHYRGKETTYSLRLIPAGGYVRLAGLEDNDEYFTAGQPIVVTFDETGAIDCLSFEENSNLADGLPVEVVSGDMEKAFYLEAIPYGETEPKRYPISRNAVVIEPDGNAVRIAPPERQFQEASLLARLTTNLAGPVQNFILGILAFILLGALQGGVPSNSTVIGTIEPDSPAAMAALQPGDQVLTVDGANVDSFQDLQRAVQGHADETIPLEFARGDTEETVMITPRATKLENGETIGLIGAGQSKKTGVWSMIKYGFSQAWAIISGVFGIIFSMFKNGFDINNFGGPVYIYQATTQVAEVGFSAIVGLMAYLSINLGVVNLLPVPALDGGKVLLNIIEAVRGKPLSTKTEGIINLVGAVLVFILFIAVTWNDIMRFF